MLPVTDCTWPRAPGFLNCKQQKELLVAYKFLRRLETLSWGFFGEQSHPQITHRSGPNKTSSIPSLPPGLRWYSMIPNARNQSHPRQNASPGIPLSDARLHQSLGQRRLAGGMWGCMTPHLPCEAWENPCLEVLLWIHLMKRHFADGGKGHVNRLMAKRMARFCGPRLPQLVICRSSTSPPPYCDRLSYCQHLSLQLSFGCHQSLLYIVPSLLFVTISQHPYQRYTNS